MKFGFIGCGNMGGALAACVAKQVGGENVAVCDHNVEKVDALVSRFGVVAKTAQEIAKNARFVVLVVKPQGMEKTLLEIKDALQENPAFTLITMAAGLPMERILEWAGTRSPIIRIMPNTPCELGEGVILTAFNGVDEAAWKEFFNAFSAAGKLFSVDEATLDEAGALSGCGPAFVYLFAEALACGANRCGVEKKLAVELAAQTLLGAAKMLQTYGEPIALKDKVCSPGGTTLAGIAAMEEAGFSKAAESAVTAAYQRTLELRG